MRFVLSVDTESRFFDAGYFYLNYKKSTLTMDLIQVPETKYAEDRERKIWKVFFSTQGRKTQICYCNRWGKYSNIKTH